MQMTFRWYGEGNDSITQEQIKQIPGVTGLVWALHDKQPGEVWEINEIEKVRKQIEGYGFNIVVGDEEKLVSFLIFNFSFLCFVIL